MSQAPRPDSAYSRTAPPSAARTTRRRTPPNRFRVGPGVAPRAHLYAVRVFGCAGSTNETVDAIEWSVDNGMDVINMSLGRDFGKSNDPSAVAADNAAQAGIVVVASAGNDGPEPIHRGLARHGHHVVSVAANESLSAFPGFTLTLPTTPSPITAINANGEPDVPNGTQYTIVSVNNNPATPTVDESLGCNVSDYPAPPNATSLAVIDPRSLRPRREGHPQPAGRLRGGGDGGQHHRSAAVRRTDLLPPGHGRAVHGHDPVHRRSRAWPRRRPRTAPGSVRHPGTLTTVNNIPVSNPNFTGSPASRPAGRGTATASSSRTSLHRV